MAARSRWDGPGVRVGIGYPGTGTGGVARVRCVRGGHVDAHGRLVRTMCVHVEIACITQSSQIRNNFNDDDKSRFNVYMIFIVYAIYCHIT